MAGLILFLLPCFLCFISICITFVGLHKLLKHKEPFSYACLYPYLGISNNIPKIKTSNLNANPDAIAQLVKDINKFFISKWFIGISKDKSFPTESTVFLEEVLTRIANVQLQVSNKQLVHGVFNIILKHLKEYTRALKRKEKYNVAIENLYRYSHTCSVLNSKKSVDFFLHQLTINLLRHFINSELWNSLPSHILVAIIARSFISYFLRLFSNPDILNHLLLMSISSSATKEKLKLNNYTRISLVGFYEPNIDVVGIKEPHLKIKSKKNENGADEIKKIIVSENKMVVEPIVENKVLESTKERNLSEDNDVILRRRNAPQLKKTNDTHAITKSPLKKSDPVKIYESKSASKTWRDSRDLACISLGQDPLDYLPNIENVKLEENRSDSPTGASNIFNDVINITSMEGLKSSIKPISQATERTLHNIKDLQETTMNNALNKIGDFQVIENDNNKKIEKLNYSIHTLPPNTLLHSSVLSNTQNLLQVSSEDEAVGVVEGILDFGRAGFRKGLKLTGLQENIDNAKSTFTNVTTAKTRTKAMREQVRKKLEDFRQSDSDSGEKFSISDSVEMIQMDSPSFSDQNMLKSSVDSPKKLSQQIEELPIPPIYTEQPSENDSPDPEYEDTADLASSIAKLRSLLQQRSSESGFSTPATSPMPDEFIQKPQESENVSDSEAMEVDGMMPSFYKFCTKTASDVLSNTLNTIKTALPGNNSGYFYSVLKWKFKAEIKESDTLLRMKKLLTERKEYCILDKEIDTGFDVLDSVDIFQQSPVRMSNLQFEDELDDFEAKIPITKVCLDIMCELLADTNSFLIQEPVVKGILLTCGALIEQNIESGIDGTFGYLATNLIKIPEKSSTKILSMTIDEYIEELCNGFPDIIRIIFQKENLHGAVKLFVSAIQKQNINQDVVLQIFEFVTMKLIEESNKMSPPISA